MMQHNNMSFKWNNVPVTTNTNQFKKTGCGSLYFIITNLINIFKMFRVCQITKQILASKTFFHNFLSLIGYPKSKSL